jgi:hypothetical protein
MDNAAQRAGNIFATIVGLIEPGIEVAEVIGMTAKIAGAFTVELVGGEIGGEAGAVLRASDESGTPLVEIWAKGPDGRARAMTVEEAETLKGDLADEGELLTTLDLHRTLSALPFASKAIAIVLHLSNTPSWARFQGSHRLYIWSRGTSEANGQSSLYALC